MNIFDRVLFEGRLEEIKTIENKIKYNYVKSAFDKVK